MPPRKPRRIAVTLVEVIAVTAIILLLLAMISPSLQQIRSSSHVSACLYNLQQIGSAVMAYAYEDPAEQAIPIHANMVQTCSYWEWRTANWFAWGGQSATERFQLGGGLALWLGLIDQLPPVTLPAPLYDQSNRPLNGYVATLDVFHCPNDEGYPVCDLVYASPYANLGIPCWSSLGNSYRANLASYVQIAGGGTQGASRGAYAYGPWGHRLSTISSPQRVVLMAEPLLGAQLGTIAFPGVPPELAWGWHNAYLTNNALMCDGSARPVRTCKESSTPDLLPAGPPVYDFDLLTRCSDWQLDCYPTPGAIIWGNWVEYTHGPAAGEWPWKDYQDNLR
jgi:type II secretory pathway pseudopilin PulG